MTAQVAFLRGINVGGHNRIGMQRLRELLSGAGYQDVRTHLQSGNAVFRVPGTSERTRADLEGRIARELGLDVPVLVRERDELADVLAADPLRQVVTDPAKSLVAFLSRRPDPEAVAALDPAEFAPDEFRVRGREIYLWCPNGVRRTKLTNAFLERRLGVSATVRNWSTVAKMAELADAVGE